MRLPKRGEKGFTLIELLIVVAILGVLAAVVIPNVTRFVGAGKQEAAETELHNIQLAVTSMMLENGLTSILTPGYPDSGAAATNQMAWSVAAGFPDWGSVCATTKMYDPDGVAYVALTDQDGYVLFGHDMKAADGTGELVNYVVKDTTTHYYTCDGDGTVRQYADDTKTAMP